MALSGERRGDGGLRRRSYNAAQRRGMAWRKAAAERKRVGGNHRKRKSMAKISVKIGNLASVMAAHNGMVNQP